MSVESSRLTSCDVLVPYLVPLGRNCSSVQCCGNLSAVVCVAGFSRVPLFQLCAHFSQLSSDLSASTSFSMRWLKVLEIIRQVLV